MFLTSSRKCIIIYLLESESSHELNFNPGSIVTVYSPFWTRVKECLVRRVHARTHARSLPRAEQVEPRTNPRDQGAAASEKIATKSRFQSESRWSEAAETLRQRRIAARQTSSVAWTPAGAARGEGTEADRKEWRRKGALLVPVMAKVRRRKNKSIQWETATI